MKKPKIIRLRLLFKLAPGKSRRRGVAIITVLAIVSLMTVLIISFFNMAQSQKVTAIGTVEMQRVVTLKDTAINLVMAQIRQATTLPKSSGAFPIWTSGPGNMRTFHGSNVDYNRCYKLYSAEKMVISGIATGPSGARPLMEEIENDVDPQWDKKPDMYVDLNRPVVPSNAAKDVDNPQKLKARLIYPIADPSRYNGQDSDTNNTEGFSYGKGSLSSKKINGVDAQKSQLAMPVRWIYFLQDGSPGVVGSDGKFKAMGKAGGQPTEENPIVSRIAWWTDDETCKINVNTASLPIPWDSPRTASAEDVWYAQHQPANGEVHHYPGHPSQTDMSAVLFPGFRFSPDASIAPGGKMSALPAKYASLIWNIAPFVTEEGGTFGGTKKTALATEKPVVLDNSDRLYSTFEELYFKAKDEEANLNRSRGDVSKDDTGGKMLERLEASQFFLTTRSQGPELNIFGYPRLCMFPMNQGVLAEVGKTGGTLSNQVGAFEVTMATNSTISGFPYYFQRTDAANSRHNAFFAALGGRNSQLFTYLKNLTSTTPPGHPELPSDFSTFTLKYPGPNGTQGDKPGSEYDSSDRTQILLSILDLLRSTNMSPGYLASGSAYDSGRGQVSGICGCNRINDSDPQPKHTEALAWNAPYFTPKGSGRTYGPAEICIFAHVVAYKKGKETSPIPGGIALSAATQDKWNKATAASLIQTGILINAFSPRQGWAPLFAEAGLNISNKTATSGTDPRSPANSAVPIIFAGASPEEPLRIGANTNGISPAATGGDPPVPQPASFIPWAGMVGARMMATAKVATFEPMVYTGANAGSPNTIPLQLKWRSDVGDAASPPPHLLRVFIYDDPDPSNFNVIQGIDIELGETPIQMEAQFTGGKTIEQLLAGTLSQGPGSFPPPGVAMTSLVVPHGDYRLTTTSLRVERGIFVPNGSGRHSVVEPVLQGNNATYQKGNFAELAVGKDSFFGVQNITAPPETSAPHLAPVRPEDCWNEKLGTQPMKAVQDVASSSGDLLRLRRFSHGRRDGLFRDTNRTPAISNNKIPNRGSSDPIETGDFDTGLGLCPDGAYMNQPDDGDARDAQYPYYANLSKKSKVSPATFSPNRLVRSPVDFGSIPSGLQARVPWQTLRFRPDHAMNNPDYQYKTTSFNPPVSMKKDYGHYYPFSNYCGPRDHLLLDLFWMPVVEPWAISEGFATKGLINLNQQIYPFTYIQRVTALHALLRGERMMAIPDTAGQEYKNGASLGSAPSYRHYINAKETLRQLVEYRWNGQDHQGYPVTFNSFRSASEICELWLVPDSNPTSTGATPTLANIVEFWERHRLTGDNMRERPYSNLYPRLTVRSNVYKIHIVAQTLKQARSNPVDSFTTEYKEGKDPDQVTAEWRGSALIERVINPNDPEMLKAKVDYAAAKTPDALFALPRLDNYYSYRVTEVKQLTE